jgi:hypothetical protein
MLRNSTVTTEPCPGVADLTQALSIVTSETPLGHESLGVLP